MSDSGAPLVGGDGQHHKASRPRKAIDDVAVALHSPPVPQPQDKARELDKLYAPYLISTAEGSDRRRGDSLPVARPFYFCEDAQPAKMNKTLEAYLEPRIGDDDSRFPSVEPEEQTPANILDLLVPQPSRAPVLSISDPVGVGLVSEPEAQWLFKRFADHVSTSSHVFDHRYHTYERVRGSPVLFNAVMYAASRFFRPHIADWCLDMAETAISRAMRNADIDLPLVQALLTLVYWKRPKDPTAYYKLGLATRCICQLGVKWQIDDWDPSTVASDEDKERAKVDAERTAYTAFGMDNSYGVMFRLPSMGWPIPSARKLRVWALNHAHLGVTGDFFKVFLTECWEMHQEIGDYSRPPSTANEPVDELSVCSLAMEQVTTLSERWLSDAEPTGVLRPIMVLILKMMLMKRHVVNMVYGLSTMSAVLDLLKDCADAVLELVSSGEVVFLSDMSTVSLSMPGLLAFHARNDMSQQDVSRVIDILRVVSTAVDKLSPVTGDDHPLRYVQRCHHRVISALERFQPNQKVQGTDYQEVLAHLQQLLGDNWTHTAAPDLSNDSAFLNDPFWLYPTHVV
ncbi:hypothetical protein Q8F55_007306 [Vanrija albida]|uniref:Transcription factor domain-containing protein n=1 Tax=Vanrija albida TaxID=181172 RepID=A0ABR3PZR7_9TREE